MKYPERLRAVLVERLASGELTDSDTIIVSGEKVPVKTVAKHFGLNTTTKDIKANKDEGMEHTHPTTDQPGAA